MKELEQEKDSLLAGLEAVERARDWYQGQIHNVTERQRQVGQSSHCTVSSNPAVKQQDMCLKTILLHLKTSDMLHSDVQSRLQ